MVLDEERKEAEGVQSDAAFIALLPTVCECIAIPMWADGSRPAGAFALLMAMILVGCAVAVVWARGVIARHRDQKRQVVIEAKAKEAQRELRRDGLLS